MSALTQKFQNVVEKISSAEKRASSPIGSTILIAASKTKSIEAILDAASAGVTHFGENYVQEAVKKIEKIKKPDIYWHLIGSLQTNKSKSVVGRFETIQSVDRLELARALSLRAIEANVNQKILIQIKLGDEPTKGGISPKETPRLIEEICKLKNLSIDGLMSLPPIEAEAEGSRKYFAQLRECRQRWSSLISSENGTFKNLSMGTTHDFVVAIEEGATMVRVGTAIFGAREISDSQ